MQAIIVMACLPFLINRILRNSDNLKKFKSVSLLYSDLKMKGYALGFNIVFILRRWTFAIILILLTNYPIIQITLIIL